LICWAIGQGESYSDRAYQDQVESEALYEILERDVIPAFYDRRADGLPRRWISLMKASIGSVCHRFNTNRMVREYTERFYLVSHADHLHLLDEHAARARSLAASLARIRKAWPQVRIEILDPGLPAEIPVGRSIRFQAIVRTGSLTSEDIKVELCCGQLNTADEIVEAVVTEMKPIEPSGGGYLYEAAVVPSFASGRHGYTVRVLPRCRDLKAPFVPGLIRWADETDASNLELRQQVAAIP